MRSLLFLLPTGSAVLSLMLLALPSEVHGQDDEKKVDDVQREKLLKAMKSLAASYTLSIDDNRSRRLKLAENPLIRFSNPVGWSKDGAVFVWTENGRPHALLKVYTDDLKSFFQEWQSLSEDRLVAERGGQQVWTPTRGGIEFREVPDAPKPAETAAERLLQMKKLAGQYRALYREDDELRLLAKPMHRYESKGTPSCLDGSLFGFAQSTTPMVIIQLEARQAGETNRWHYAIARLSTLDIKVSHADKEVFSVPRFNSGRDSTLPFLPLDRVSIPME